MPPPTSGLPARLALGPALRAQSDGRLVRLVREGYESAFEEIVRRYRRPLDRFAAGIVGRRSEDVIQDAFRKALEALRRGDAEVELRPWLYRIVRNTALNDLRDRPPAAAELADDLIGGGRSAAAEAEGRAEVAALISRLRALPEKQRAALVMRELEGMSHEDIAAALGVSHGAARQAIARGRAAVRSGFGALVPLPLLRALASGGDGAAEAVGAGVAGSVAGGAAIGGGAGALKVGLATLAVAGSIGAGVAIDHHGSGHSGRDAAKAGVPAPGGPGGEGVRPSPSPVIVEDGDHGPGSEAEPGDDHGGDGEGGDDHGGPSRHRRGDEEHQDHRGPGGGDDDSSPPPALAEPTATDRHHGGKGADAGPSLSEDSGTSGESGSGSTEPSGGGSSHGSGSGSSTSGSGGHGSDDAAATVAEAAPTITSTVGGSESSSSGSGTSGSGGGSGSGSSGDS